MDDERSTVPLTPAGEALRRGLFTRRTDDEFEGVVRRIVLRGARSGRQALAVRIAHRAVSGDCRIRAPGRLGRRGDRRDARRPVDDTDPSVGRGARARVDATHAGQRTGHLRRLRRSCPDRLPGRNRRRRRHQRRRSTPGDPGSHRARAARPRHRGCGGGSRWIRDRPPGGQQRPAGRRHRGRARPSPGDDRHLPAAPRGRPRQRRAAVVRDQPRRNRAVGGGDDLRGRVPTSGRRCARARPPGSASRQRWRSSLPSRPRFRCTPASAVIDSQANRTVDGAIADWDPLVRVVTLDVDDHGGDVTVDLVVSSPSDPVSVWQLARLLRERLGKPVQVELRVQLEQVDRAIAS